MKQQNIKCESNFNELNEKLSNSLKSMDVKINEMNIGIVKLSNKRWDEFMESQKQSIEQMKVGKIDSGKCKENINNEDNLTNSTNKVIDNEVSEDGENISDNHNACLLYTSRCV